MSELWDEQGPAAVIRNGPHATESYHPLGDFDHISNFVWNYLT
jgi:hypothetical protein